MVSCFCSLAFILRLSSLYKIPDILSHLGFDHIWSRFCHEYLNSPANNEKMVQFKKPTFNTHDRVCIEGDSGLVLTADPKPHLRWTVELHERFVEAVNKLGGPHKAPPKTILKIMGVKGLTLYHLKSHLQKFRLGRQPQQDFDDQSLGDVLVFDFSKNVAGTRVGCLSDQSVQQAGEVRMQMEVRRRLNEELGVQKHLQMRIDAQGNICRQYWRKQLRKHFLKKILTLSATYILVFKSMETWES